MGLFHWDGQLTPLAELAAELGVDYSELRAWLEAEVAARRAQQALARSEEPVAHVTIAPGPAQS